MKEFSEAEKLQKEKELAEFCEWINFRRQALYGKHPLAIVTQPSGGF